MMKRQEEWESTTETKDKTFFYIRKSSITKFKDDCVATSVKGPCTFWKGPRIVYGGEDKKINTYLGSGEWMSSRNKNVKRGEWRLSSQNGRVKVTTIVFLYDNKENK